MIFVMITHANFVYVLLYARCKKVSDAMSELKCKMSTYEAKKNQDARVCALALNVECEGLKKDTGRCPFWKRGDGEP